MSETKRKKLTGEIKISEDKFKEVALKVKTSLDVAKALKERLLDKDTTGAIGFLLASAIVLDASDIHTEPEEEQVRIRFRIDGILRDVAVIEHSAYETLLSRIKLMAGLKLNVSDRPQDGRFTVEAKSPMEIRASSLPSEHGETIVLRILNPQNLITLKDLGLRDRLLTLFKKEIKSPNGMILVTGPTGSGKTTTLYSFLQEIQRPEIKVITIEDPIEYHIKGISQTQVQSDKGYDFATGLRAIVRQDPDVILVGEMRDLETVEIALQAALTGHLVFSTLHTNDAAGTITRLISLGAKTANIAPALNLAIAQRLVRKVCKKSAGKRAATAEELKEIKEALKALSAKERPKIGDSVDVPVAKGCSECNDTGYKGRAGLFEAIVVDDELRELILKSPSTTAVQALAEKKGMIPMRTDGLLRIVEGITTFEELNRVTEEESE
ncbi:MAG TPA: type II/IV secretion system protein [candidate division CPR3 bacterium]|uniref:Type II/IV secretion system protein n=1 Tax=candidate division CPR3 bacterium TaxID=2268181 RepID=A0A7C1SNQ8_UNCC3|nr:type II/IV secretion system protein [candidate division CPR3 bacterium]